MHSSAASAENDTGYIDPVEKKVLDLIQRFNDPDHEHVLRGIFTDTDGLAEIRAKQQRASTTMGSALAELVALKTAVEFLQGQGWGPSRCIPSNSVSTQNEANPRG